MTNWTYEVATEYKFPNITVFKILKDGVLNGYRINTNDGYVMYDTRRNDTDIDPDTMQEIPVTYYYTVSSVPVTFDFVNFPWVAVPRDSVDENYIFGSGNTHETM